MYINIQTYKCSVIMYADDYQAYHTLYTFEERREDIERNH